MNEVENKAPIALALGGLIAIAIAVGIGRFVYTPILPWMVDDLGMTKSAAGALASANLIGYFTGALAAARANLPGSRRSWMLAALAITALSTAAMSGADSFVTFVVAAALVLDRLAALQRPRLAAIHFAGVGSGISLAALTVAGLAWFGGGWRSMWLVSGMISIIGLGLVFMLIPAQSEPRLVVNARRGSLSPAMRRLILAYGLYGFGYSVTTTFLVAIVRASPELKNYEPYAWLFVGLSAMPSIAIWSALARRVSNANAFALACVVEAIGVLVSVWTTSLLGLIVAAVFLGGTFVAITALGFFEARRLSQAGGDAQRAIAVMSAAFGFGQIVGPTLAGIGHDLSGSFVIPSVAASVALMIGAALTARGSRTA
jgi:predicted MFS family arabinose efflux permease